MWRILWDLLIVAFIIVLLGVGQMFATMIDGAIKSSVPEERAAISD
jgi:hypothetical protein